MEGTWRSTLPQSELGMDDRGRVSSAGERPTRRMEECKLLPMRYPSHFTRVAGLVM